MKQVKIKKRQSEYCIAKNFYSKLTIYIVSMIVLIIFLAFFISGFAYLAGIPFESFPILLAFLLKAFLKMLAQIQVMHQIIYIVY